MRDGGDILALGRNARKAIDESVAELPLGIDATLVSDQPVVVFPLDDTGRCWRPSGL
jgi:multidrug efflux pump subunit AcrB